MSTKASSGTRRIVAKELRLRLSAMIRVSRWLISWSSSESELQLLRNFEVESIDDSGEWR
jgi:hypothetical protein